MHLGAELGGGCQDDDAGGVAHGEAVAEALLLLAQRLHKRQQIRQRLAAPCTITRANTLVPNSLITSFASSQNAKFTPWQSGTGMRILACSRVWMQMEDILVPRQALAYSFCR